MVLQPLMLKQFLRAGPHRRVLMETFFQERNQRPREAFRNRRRLVFYNPEHHYACVRYQRLRTKLHKSVKPTCHSITDIPIWRASRQQFYNRTSERPDIRLCRCAFELNDFGSHPIRRASDVLDLALHRAQVERHTKVRQFDVPSLRSEDVGRLEVAMHDVALVQVIEPLEDLEHIARNQLLVQLAERLESLSERAILGVSARGAQSDSQLGAKGKECAAAGSSTQAGAYKRGNALEYDAQRILVPSHPFILDDTRVRQPFDEVDLPHKLRDFLLLESFKPDPFHSYHLPGIQVERAIHSAKLSSSNTVAQLLSKVR